MRNVKKRLGCRLILAGITLGLLVCIGNTLAAEDTPEVDPRARLAEYEPSAAFPFGRPNPGAPPEIAQFDFMVGEFDCVDRGLQRDGSWREMKTIWKAFYFMNGYAIQDIHWKQGFAATNLRFYDRATEKWQVSWFKMPPYGSSSGWQGTKEGHNMVMRKEEHGPNGQKVVDVLTFYEIRPESYEWKAERIVDGELPYGGPHWKISCRRRR